MRVLQQLGHIKFALALTAVILAFSSIAHADPQDPTRDTPLADPAQEAKARAFMREIRCVVCQSQSIDESDAEIAAQLRNAIREQMKAGKSEDEIRDYLVARYGDFVLLKPPFKPATLLLWIGPFVPGRHRLGLRPAAAPAEDRRSAGRHRAGPAGLERDRARPGAAPAAGRGRMMILLWIIFGVMTLAAALILAWPLFDSRRFKNDSSFALAVYRDQLAEINHDAARGHPGRKPRRARRRSRSSGAFSPSPMRRNSSWPRPRRRC